MAKHQIDLTDVQEKALSIATQKYNSDRDMALSVDEFLQNMIEPFARPLVAQVHSAMAAPLVNAIMDAIVESDDSRLLAVKAALEITPE